MARLAALTTAAMLAVVCSVTCCQAEGYGYPGPGGGYPSPSPTPPAPTPSGADLAVGFYRDACPNAEAIVKKAVEQNPGRPASGQGGVGA